MDTYTVDRIEGNVVVLLKKGNESISKNIPISQFPHDIKDGDIVMETREGEKTSYKILVDETNVQRKKANELLEKLKNKQL
jgi:hypothetical protein